MQVLCSVFPTLTARGAYRNIYTLDVDEVGDTVTSLLGRLEQSQISHLALHASVEDVAPFADALIRLLNCGRLRFLDLFSIDLLDSPEQLARVVEAISTAQPERSLINLSVPLSEPSHVEALMALVANNATHKLQNIGIDGQVAGFDDVVGTGISIFRLLTIPTLRFFGVAQESQHYLTPEHVTVVRDCVRERARTDSPPFQMLAFEDNARVVEDIRAVMIAESPTTSVMVLGQSDLGTLWKSKVL